MATITSGPRSGGASAEESRDPASALVEWANGWEIEETDFGTVFALHRHLDGSHVAYVTADADGPAEARCSGCCQIVQVPALGALAR